MLYYSITSARTVETTYPNSNGIPAEGWQGYARPTGLLAIPAVVRHNGTTYAVAAVGNYSFMRCDSITAVVLPSSVASVGTSAFMECSRLLQFEASEGFTQLGIGALRYCSSLHSVSLPTTITALQGSALADCPSLREVRCLSATPPTTATSVFSNVPLDSCTLIVAWGCETAYRTAQPWSMFHSITSTARRYSIATHTNNANRGTVNGGGSYAEGSTITLTALPFDGCFFACWADGDTTNPRRLIAQSDTIFTALFFEYPSDSNGTLPHPCDTLRRTDTIFLADTLCPSLVSINVLSAQPNLGSTAGQATVPVGSQLTIAAIASTNATFFQWTDGCTDNPRIVDATADSLFIALFEPLGISQSRPTDVHVNVVGMEIVVETVPGMPLVLYTSDGRCLAHAISSANPTSFIAPERGVYVLCVGDNTARKIVVSGRNPVVR